MSDTPTYITGKNLPDFLEFIGGGIDHPEIHTAHLPGRRFTGAAVFVCKSEDWQSQHARWYPATGHDTRNIAGDTLGGCLDLINSTRGTTSDRFTLDKPVILKTGACIDTVMLLGNETANAALYYNGGEWFDPKYAVIRDHAYYGPQGEGFFDTEEEANKACGPGRRVVFARVQFAPNGNTIQWHIVNPIPPISLPEEDRQALFAAVTATIAKNIAEKQAAENAIKTNLAVTPEEEESEPLIDYSADFKDVDTDEGRVESIAAHGRGQEVRHLVRYHGEIVEGRDGSWGEYVLKVMPLCGNRKCEREGDEAWCHAAGTDIHAFTGQQIRSMLRKLDAGTGELVPENVWETRLMETMTDTTEGLRHLACETEECATVAAKGHEGWMTLWNNTQYSQPAFKNQAISSLGHEAVRLLKIADASLSDDEAQSASAYEEAKLWINGGLASPDNDLEVALHQCLLYSVSSEVPDDYMKLLADHANPKVRKVMAESGIIAAAYDVSATHRRIIGELARDENEEVSAAARESLKQFGGIKL